MKSKYLFSLICTYLSLWSFTFFKKVKNMFTKANSRSRKIKNASQNVSQRKTRSQTYSTAPVVTKGKTYYAFTGEILNWYKRKKRVRPWLWWWLPLFITLLLLTSMLSKSSIFLIISFYISLLMALSTPSTFFLFQEVWVCMQETGWDVNFLGRHLKQRWGSFYITLNGIINTAFNSFS